MFSSPNNSVNYLQNVKIRNKVICEENRHFHGKFTFCQSNTWQAYSHELDKPFTKTTIYTFS